MAGKREKIILYSALLFCSAAVVIRCLQFFLHTNLKTGYLQSGSMVYSVLIAVFSVGAIVCSFLIKPRENTALLMPEKKGSARLFMLLSGVVLFFDFVRQCINVYSYFSKNTYVKWNYVIPLLLFGVLALASGIYFIAFAFLSKSRGYDLNRVRLFHYVPLFWAVFGLLTSLSTLESLHDVQQAVYKTAALIFATLFFAAYAAAFSNKKFSLRLVSGFGFSYSFISAVYAVPELLGLAVGLYGFNSVYFAGTYLLTGAFAYAAARDLIEEQ